jgi:hypothetical protein
MKDLFNSYFEKDLFGVPYFKTSYGWCFCWNCVWNILVLYCSFQIVKIFSFYCFMVHFFAKILFFILNKINLRRISEFFMLRDYTNIPNILLFQYTVERNEAKYVLLDMFFLFFTSTYKRGIKFGYSVRLSAA